jgi:hypothetical protein
VSGKPILSTSLSDQLTSFRKSQIAIEYAYRVQQEQPKTMVFWIHASEPARFEEGYRAVADEVALPGREDPNADTLQLVYSWLSDRQNGRWLMILDNVDDDGVFFANGEDYAGSTEPSPRTSSRKSLDSFLPQTPNGAILITSRSRTASFNLVGHHDSILSVNPMEEADALALLKTRVPFDDAEEVDAKALVQVLGHIPLVITHAAAYIETRASITSISSYLEMFRTSEEYQIRLLENNEVKDLRRDRSIQDPVIRTWQISFNQIQNSNREAADLLALMSMFENRVSPGLYCRAILAG